MATVISFNVQYYNAYGNLILTKQINFNDINYGTEDSPEYYSSSPGLSGYTNAYVEDSFGNSLDMHVLDDGSFLTYQDWVSVLATAAGPLKVYSNDYTGEGGGGGGSGPSTGVLQGTTKVTLIDENSEIIWSETINIYTAGSEETPYLSGSLSIPKALLEQYSGWYQISGYYYDYFDNGTLEFYSWDGTLFTEDIVIQGYYNGGGNPDLPTEPVLVTITYVDETNTYPTETDQVYWYPDNGYGEFIAADWSSRLNSNGENFLFWQDEDGNYYTPGEYCYVGHNNITLYARWNTIEEWEVYLELYDSDGTFLALFTYRITPETPIVDFPYYSDGTREVEYWSGDSGPIYPGDYISFEGNGQTITLIAGGWVYIGGSNQTECIVSYDLDGGSDPSGLLITTSLGYVEDNGDWSVPPTLSYTIPNVAPIKDNATFEGWLHTEYTNDGAIEVLVKPGDTIQVYGIETLKAKWQKTGGLFIKIAGEQKKGIVFIKKNGLWKKAVKTFVKKLDEWK